MSRFSNLADGARQAHAYYFADSVIVYQIGSPAATVQAVVGRIRTETRVDENGRHNRVSTRNLRFTTLTTIRHDATVNVDGVHWSIDEVLKRSASGLSVRLVRHQAHDVTRKNYRGKP